MSPVITLTGIELPGDLQWTDEYQWSPIAQSVTETLTGALIVEESVLQAGRPITLVGGDDYAWVTRATVDALYALLTPGREMTLTLADGRVFAVTWRHSDSPIDARPVLHSAPSTDDDWYTLILRLMQV